MTGFDELYVIVTDRIPVQLENAILLSVVIPLGIDNDVKCAQVENALALIVVTPVGIVNIPAKFVQELNALTPIVINELGSAIKVRPLHP